MPIIYLIGARGSGKTTVGRALSARLGWRFADLDERLCRKLGKSVAEIVAAEGWEGFRRHECENLFQATRFLAKNENAAVSTGGGIVLMEENRRHMAENGLPVWLKADAALLHKRLSANPLLAQRPSLTGKGLLEELEQTLAEREELYAQCARHVVSADLPVAEICERIAAFCKA